MASVCAARSDCCMSEMFVCTRESLLLKSNSASTPSRMMMVTRSETATSTRVKPRCLAAFAESAGDAGDVVGISIMVAAPLQKDLMTHRVIP